MNEKKEERERRKEEREKKRKKRERKREEREGENDQDDEFFQPIFSSLSSDPNFLTHHSFFLLSFVSFPRFFSLFLSLSSTNLLERKREKITRKKKKDARKKVFSKQLIASIFYP